MKIKLDDIKSLMSSAIDNYALTHGCSEVDLDQDLYWFVPDDQLFNVADKPDNLAIGSLVEEFASLHRDWKSGVSLGCVSMQHLAALLIWLSARAGAREEDA